MNKVHLQCTTWITYICALFYTQAVFLYSVYIIQLNNDSNFSHWGKIVKITVYNLPHLTTVAWFDSHLIEFHSLGASSEDDVVIGSLHLLILLMEITLFC